MQLLSPFSVKNKITAKHRGQSAKLSSLSPLLFSLNVELVICHALLSILRTMKKSSILR